MAHTTSRWKKLFLFCLGLALGTSFCMKWLESSFYSNNELFTIMGLELFYPREKVIAILAGLDAHVKSILRFHLSFDFAFMAGVFPGIAAACMMARERLQQRVGRMLLFLLATLQTVAWALDIIENCQLFSWIDKPVIDKGFVVFHIIVAAKWIIALTGALTAIIVLMLHRSVKSQRN